MCDALVYVNCQLLDYNECCQCRWWLRQRLRGRQSLSHTSPAWSQFRWSHQGLWTRGGDVETRLCSKSWSHSASPWGKLRDRRGGISSAGRGTRVNALAKMRVSWILQSLWAIMGTIAGCGLAQSASKGGYQLVRLFLTHPMVHCDSIF